MPTQNRAYVEASPVLNRSIQRHAGTFADILPKFHWIPVLLLSDRVLRALQRISNYTQ